MLYNRIKVIYPNIEDTEFELQNDSNGLGDYIKTWNSLLPKPTKAQLAAVTQQQLNQQLSAATSNFEKKKLTENLIFKAIFMKEKAADPSLTIDKFIADIKAISVGVD